MLRPGGRYLSIGVGGNPSLPVASLARMVTFIGVSIAEPRHWLQAVRFLQTRRHVRWDRMISASYTLDQTTQAFQDMASFAIVKPVIFPHGGRL
jgi:threonine dehydrogenase-like Zn-dependent dehydrogenase